MDGPMWAERGALTEATVTLVLPSWEPLFIEKQAKIFETGASRP